MKSNRFARQSSRNLTCAAACLALCMGLPFLTGQIPQIGRALSPMHIPVLLAGFLCGPWWAMAVGFIAPILRHFWLTMPPLLTALAMSFELATYGFVSGILYCVLPKKVSSIYASLITAMLVGRAVWGCAMLAIMGITGSVFTWAAFLSDAFINTLPGIVVHIILIPVIVIALQRVGFLAKDEKISEIVIEKKNKQTKGIANIEPQEMI